MAKRCLVLGSANCLRDDIAAALRLSEFEGVVAAKHAGIEWSGPLDAWVSLHPDKFGALIAEREKKGYESANRLFGHIPVGGVCEGTSYKFEGQKRSGSSGLFAAKVAIDLGFDRLVLCGIPLEKEKGRIDGKDHWNGAYSFRQGFLEAIPTLAGRARSMSGWTQVILGTPTSEWLNGSLA